MVEKEIKGGFSIKISASASGFCPYSQMNTKKKEKARISVATSPRRPRLWARSVIWSKKPVRSV